ncbi:hypothetical protein ACLK1G_16550 [Pseudomonas sp. NR3]|uniref:hypothetical protein n=1 Tax=Pseudomonas sp. NR3 TaxID=3155978 RepID=UPI003B676019
MNDTQPISLDYRSSMQQAALAYLARHQAEHLADGDQLFKNCIHHLIVALEVPSGIATKLVQLAWTEHNAASGLDHPSSL